MKKTILIGLAVLAGTLAASCPAAVDTTTQPSPTTPPAGSYSLSLVFAGPAVSPNTVYAAWIEDESGNDVQNVYVCHRVLSINPATGALWQDRGTYGLTGDGLPNWLLKKYDVRNGGSGNKVIDGVTGASTQQNKTISVQLSLGAVTRFRVCFEIDRSRNNNASFEDRPAFTYRTAVIDLADILTTAAYSLALDGWMSNDTDSSPYSQQPTVSIPGYVIETYMNDTSWIAPTGDMVTSVTATITKN